MMQVGKINFAPSKTYVQDCPNCKRLKALLETANFLLDSYADVLGGGKKYEKFMKEFKKEGIE